MHRAIILLLASILQGVVLVVVADHIQTRLGSREMRTLRCSWSSYGVYDLEIIDFIGCLMRHADTAARVAWSSLRQQADACETPR